MNTIFYVESQKEGVHLKDLLLKTNYFCQFKFLLNRNQSRGNAFRHFKFVYTVDSPLTRQQKNLFNVIKLAPKMLSIYSNSLKIRFAELIIKL